MTEKQIIDETLRYINDKSYQYAILIDGEWGSGKTFFVTNKLKMKIDELEAISEHPRKVKYISLYGCKNTSDIQENLVWEIADEARRIITRKVGISEKIKSKNWKKCDEKHYISDNILLSTKKIGNEIVKKFFPKNTVYDIVSDWINLKSYIFIFDDLERCDCPLNEVFGILNGLVEHEGTKVIIIANEKEIREEKLKSNVELQYMIALDNSIEWPKWEEKNSWLSQCRDKNKIRLDELEWRKSVMFPETENLSDYKRIREKLIGVTLRYQPDMDSIIEQIITTTQQENEHKDILMSLKKDFISSMNYYHHHNLRTFQFFLSKVDYLLIELKKISIHDEYKENVSAIIVSETLRCAIEYKSNYCPVDDPYSCIKRERAAKSKTIKEYVEKGEFLSEKFREDITNIIIEIKSNIPENDPFNLLYNQYYFHNQEWNVEQLRKMITNLSKDKYPFEIYEKMAITVVRLVNMGFGRAYLDEIKQYMFMNIKGRTPIKKLEIDLWYMDKGEIKDNTKAFFDDINAAIESHSEMQKRRTVNEILNDDNWTKELVLYTNALVEGTYKDISIFSQAEVDCWYNAIRRSTPKEIDDFRHWLESLYPSTSTRKSFDKDAQVLIELLKKLDPEIEQDLIKKACTKWLRNQILSIIKVNMPEWCNDMLISGESEVNDNK